MTAGAGKRVAILGAGCAGISLAHRLLEQLPGIELHILEPREQPQHDRTWCFWQFDDLPPEPSVTHRWHRMRIRTSSSDQAVDCGSTPYCHVPSSRFISRGLELVGSRCRVHLGTSAAEVIQQSDCIRIECSSGAVPDEFDHVFDGRPPPRSNVRNALYQHFVGQELEFAHDVLDPGCATLMDFDVDQSAGLHFLYVLPFTPRRALVESTFMTPEIGAAIDYNANIASYCRSRFGSSPVRCLREEQGVLPMAAGHVPCMSSQRVWQIGTRGGIGRASTGYAFDAIQRDSINVCDAFAAGRSRPRPPRSRLLTVLDRLLISLLHSRQELGPGIFEALFERAPAESIIRFLSDRPRPADILRVVSAVPAGPMIGHLLRSPRAVLP